MYGKIFDSMYQGTLYGQWEAIVTFQQMIVLCDADGMIDMTPHAIAARTSIPLEIIQKGIAVLEAPDPYSRTPSQEGRRIELIDAHKPWGWHIVNHEKYQAMQDADLVRQQTRERVRRHRASKEVERYGNAQVTDGNGRKRYTDTDTDTDTEFTTANAVVAPDGALPGCPHQKIVDAYHRLLPMCPKVLHWHEGRQGYLRARWRIAAKATWGGGYKTEAEGVEWWAKFFAYCAESKFLTGQTLAAKDRAPFVADLEWLVRPTNFTKVLEGKYHR